MRKIEQQVACYIDYCDKVLKLSSNTIKNKKWTYHQFLSFTRVNDIKKLSNKDLEEWIVHQSQNGCLGSTINTRLTQIKALVRHFERQDIYFPKLKLASVLKVKETPARLSYYDSNDIELVADSVDKRTKLMILLCYECGLRISELSSLRLANIYDRRIVFIGKGSKRREVYFSKQTKVLLDEYIKDENITDYLWIGRRGRQVGTAMTSGTIRYHLEKAFKSAGYEDFYPHALRHSFATNICNHGAPLPVAQRMLGHSRITTTERYVHSFDGHLEKYFERYRFAFV